MTRLAGKIALISGGGTGIGAACARRFADSGASLVVMGRRAAPLQAIAAGVGGVAVVGDVAVSADCQRAVRAAVESYGGLDILVCCAGILSSGAVADLEQAAWRRVLEVNLSGAMLMARAALPAMQKRPSAAIVNVASLGALVAPGKMAAYIAAKTALIGLSRSMAVDYGPRVRVNTLCPGWVLTEMSEREMEEYAAAAGISREEAIALATRFLPLRRMAMPEEIACCAEFLCSDDASFITGTVLVADGGSSAVDVGYISLAP